MRNSFDLRAAYVLTIAGLEGQLFLTGENLLNFYRQDREPKIFASEIAAHEANGNTLINDLIEYRTNPALQKPPKYSLRDAITFLMKNLINIAFQISKKGLVLSSLAIILLISNHTLHRLMSRVYLSIQIGGNRMNA